ncbi:MAG: T9SS type A sorting domain-containing protein [Flavobacteriaceae bacterium]|nr:T9SS type A sorting domain-containing protein [Flavobacteriaceae bacterium]
MKLVHTKFRTLLATIMILSTSFVIAQQNFPHIKTFGYDYAVLSDRLDQAVWLAQRHDWIVGGGQWDAAVYNAVKGANPNTKGMFYLAYHSISYSQGNWMENWATNNGLNPEDIYYHYTVDTPVRILDTEYTPWPGTPGVVNIEQSNPAVIELVRRYDLPAGARLIVTDMDGATHPINGVPHLLLPIQGQRDKYYLFTDTASPQPVDGTSFPNFSGDWTYTTADDGEIIVPGYPNGWAPTAFDSRARVRWNHGWPGINVSSNVFRRAFEALALDRLAIPGLANTYMDGLFLDTYDGIANEAFWTSNLENTMELNPDGSLSEEDVYIIVRQDLADAKMELEVFLKQNISDSFVINVNAADVDMVYNWMSNIYMDYRDETMHLSIEYLITSTTNRNRIQRMVQMYDDMDNGREMFVRSQTNFAPPTEIPYNFIQFILASHYLINHPNAHFMFHKGNAGNYGGYPYGNFEPTHWHPNMEINIGVPIAKTSADYWGITNTDRFYEFASGSDYQTLAREYSNALVIAQFGSGGWANIGNNPVTHQLDGEYYPLLDDNTNGPAITSITLGQSEGVILLKSPVEILGINTEIENKIQIYPNPAKNILTINSLGQSIKSYKIYNTIGQEVLSNSSFNTNQINISYLNSGIYFLKLTSDKTETTVKFIKK